MTVSNSSAGETPGAGRAAPPIAFTYLAIIVLIAV
jgi:hypothetical protein